MSAPKKCPVCLNTKEEATTPGCYSRFGGAYWSHCCMSPSCDCPQACDECGELTPQEELKRWHGENNEFPDEACKWVCEWCLLDLHHEYRVEKVYQADRPREIIAEGLTKQEAKDLVMSPEGKDQLHSTPEWMYVWHEN